MGEEAYPLGKPWVDECAMPEWGTAPDGRSTRIDDDARLPALFREWQADACSHESTGIVRRETSAGTTIYNRFCSACGAKSSQIPHRWTHGRAVTLLTSDEMDAVA